ncbi:MFS transporter [Glycomyces sp. TRM65418]|uniref:MFS transporter n=1 Tax=Glycomyces sp. TRM65418 TaxID=2867006 RepID=UPI001CE6BAEA|nr:MFS transporter [Glycomyces sp. TRM65418]MCC3764798.1 MFS transporter [Glycomyces sp. TRM65418]QZD54450.1 MFS transporter [Glycomyces sp. TRM65418]
MRSGLSGSRRVVLALVCAVAVSTVYGIQPILEAAGDDLGMSAGALGWLVAAGQIGYLAGLVLLVPLGDRLDRRRLITVHLLLIAAGTATTALTPGSAAAVAGLAVAGLFAVVVQTTVAYVAAVSPAAERGRNIGAVTSGVVIGILGIRVAAGALAELTDWRTVYLVLTGLCVALAFAVSGTLDADRRRPRARYGRLLAASGRLAIGDRLLRSRGLVAFFLFASFGTLWSGLALPLGEAPWHLGTGQIGLFGLAGLTGALGAARAGRWADRGLAAPVTLWSLALLTAAWLFIAQAGSSLWLLIVGVVVLDFAVQAVHVSSQHLLATAHPDRTSTVIGAYMAWYSLGSALGAVTTAWAYSAAGWPAASLLGAAYAATGLVVAAATRRSTAPSPVGRPDDAVAAKAG